MTKCKMQSPLLFSPKAGDIDASNLIVISIYLFILFSLFVVSVCVMFATSALQIHVG